MVIRLRDCPPRSSVALGATLAEQHMALVYAAVDNGNIAPGSLVTLDFGGIDGVNASYIKGTALWLFTCGQLFAKNQDPPISPRHLADPRAYDVYVCVTGLTNEVKAEFQELLKPRGLPLLLARRFKAAIVEEAVLLGHLDPALRLTLDAVVRQSTVSAPGLHVSFPNEKITVTAWNNRLNDLHALRLVRRVRAGRTWQYESLTKRIVWE